MRKINFEVEYDSLGEPVRCITKCLFNVISKHNKDVMVGSVFCQDCMHFKSVDALQKIVNCTY